MQQVINLLHLYNGLQIASIDETQISLAGYILVNRVSKGFQIRQKYEIGIVIPLESDDLPYVLDIGNYIDKSYPHRYINGVLCLETDANIKMRFIDGFFLDAWMCEYVETYFFSYEFYQRYGEFPFGEREHGLDGIIQTYSEVFREPDGIKTIKLMESIGNHDYRGHAFCPCGSGKKFRLCHGPFVMKFYMDDRFRRIVRGDYQIIWEAVKSYYEQSRNSRKTK